MLKNMRSLLILCALASCALSKIPAGTPLQLFECDGRAAQTWDLSRLNSDKTVRVASDNTLCWDLAGGSTEQGVYIEVNTCSASSKTQQWTYSTTAKTFTNVASNKVLDASNYGRTDGTSLWQWGLTGADNQKWTYKGSNSSSIVGVQSNLCVDAGSRVIRPCDNNSSKSLDYCNTKLTFQQRAKDLVARIPNDEKWGLFGNDAKGIPSLKIAAYEWWSEALHGVAGSPGVSFSGLTPYATSFPQVCVTGATFDKQLWADIGAAISDEARAFNNLGHAGLTFWAPNLNIFRDPRWGRGQETPGEDPYVTSEYVRHFVASLQGTYNNSNAKYLKVSSCCKHYAAYTLDNWKGNDRCSFNAIVTDQDMKDTYLPAFESCISPAAAGGSGIMCSYNAVNGVPSCANTHLLTTLARDTWNFNGYITGDCGAVDCVQNAHHYTTKPDDTCKVVLEAGLDLDCGSFLPQNLAKAVADGAVSMDLVNAHLENLFVVQMRLGMFDPASLQPYMNYDEKYINTVAHQRLALTAALEGIVLLKNVNNTLPLRTNVHNAVAVVGPNAARNDVMIGNYAGTPPYIVSAVAGISKLAAVTYDQGFDIASNDGSKVQAACTAAAAAKATIIVAGLDQSQESEGHDRVIISWPGIQEASILKIASCAKNPVVLVVYGGGPIDLKSVRDSNLIHAIIWAGYPGQSGGDALAQILYGKVSPSGRLPHTVYPADMIDNFPETDMGMRPNASTKNPGRTYRFYTGTPIYKFGDGLSYTNFTFQTKPASISSFQAKNIQSILDSPSYSKFEASVMATADVVVTNTGKVTSDVSVLYFTTGPNPGKNGNPIKSLAGFERVHALDAGRSVTVQFSIAAHDLAYVNSQGKYEVVPGEYKFFVEDSSITVSVL